MTDQRQYSGPESRSAAGDRSPWLIAIVVSIATFMVVLDTAIANVSLRYIAGSLAVGIDESTWVVTVQRGAQTPDQIPQFPGMRTCAHSSLSN
jgi:DHA2 family multidrug resistance protein